jgi:DNA-binding NtrC family response regulator
MPSILFVDDEPTVRQNYELLLTHSDYEVKLCSTVDEALSELAQSSFDLIITDMRMGQKSGLDLLRSARTLAPETSVIVLTGHAEVQNAIEAMKLGAQDYITKDTDYKEILLIVQKALDTKLLKDEVGRLRKRLQSDFSADKIIGTSKLIAHILATVKRVAATDSRVLITGESGTGKELIAETIHTNGPRRDYPFIAINCGAIPKDLQESELFGHVRGAFTGADRDRKGLLESAHRGTVFLDEIGDMSLETQVKLLRLLESGEFYPVGSSTARKVDIRVIAATNKDLEAAIANGLFREDLFYRLKVVVIHLPPLRERKEDIPLLAIYLLTQLNLKTHTNICGLSPEAEEVLMEYDWPGNVRELKNVLERALIFTDTDQIDVEALPEELFRKPSRGKTQRGASESSTRSLDDVEKAHILETLRRLGGNKLLTAQQLDIATTTLYRKLKQYGIE